MRNKLRAATMAMAAMVFLTACSTGEGNNTTQTAQATVASEAQAATTDADGMYIPETTTENQAAVLAEITSAVESTEKNFSVDNIQARNLVVMDRMGEEHIMGQTQLAFIYALQEMSGGKITADLYLSGEIDVDSTNLPEAYSVISVGRYQLELAEQTGYAKGAVFGLPYVFQSRDHFWAFVDSETGKTVIDEINNGGFACHALAYIEEGARSYFTTAAHPVDSYTDLAGLKLRVQSTDIYNDMVSAIGASPTTMAWSEVYTGLSSGVVDGAENPYTGYDSSMLYEVAPNIYEDEHIWGANLLTVSSSIWDSLNEDEKEMFETASQIASDYNRKHIQEVEAVIKESVAAEHGVTIKTPTSEEKQKLVEMCQPMYEKYAADYLEFIDEIKELAQ
ncbi:MAG: TRAP transporter substrate-binding protein [Clostridiales bacterium]|nr:TRAP transporter substrate-binding protein [Clostridiales bacterium]